MAISDEQYTEWLAADVAERVVLIEATYSDGIEYISDRGYRDGTTIYADRLLGNITIDSKFGAGTIGGIKVVNAGDIDEWINRRWRGHPFVVLLGDKSWARSDFRIQISGINAGLKLPSTSTYKWELFDNRKLLERDIADEDNPVLLGQVFNIEPVLIDDANLIYKVNDGTIDSFDEIRDNGNPLITGDDFSVDLTTGQFTLVNSPVGKITCDATQADKTAAQMLANLTARIDVDVDQSNLDDYGNTATLGYYTKQEVSVKSVLDKVLETTGGEYRFSTANGNLQIFRLEVPTSDVVKNIIPDDTANKSLRLVKTIDPINVMKFGYKKNWSPQSEDSTADTLTVAEKKEFSEEYEFVTTNNALDDYPIAVDKRVDSLYFLQVDAQAECDRRALIRSVERRVWEQSNFLTSAEVKIGESVNIKYPRFDFANEAGVNCRVVGTLVQLGKRRVGLSLWQ